MEDRETLFDIDDMYSNDSKSSFDTNGSDILQTTHRLKARVIETSKDEILKYNSERIMIFQRIDWCCDSR